MSQKKMAKTTANSLQKLEKNFNETPAQLLSLLRKEENTLKQQEARSNTTLNKATAQVTNAKKQLDKAAKSKSTKMGKKQFAQAQKNLNALTAALHQLAKQQQASAQLVSENQLKQSKLSALSKSLSQFEKEWAKKEKLAKAAAKAKAAKEAQAAKAKAAKEAAQAKAKAAKDAAQAKAKAAKAKAAKTKKLIKASKKSKPKAQSGSSTTQQKTVVPMNPQSPIENFETSIENEQLDETTEMAS